MYDVYAIRDDFPILDIVIYLDNAATSQTPRQSVEAMNEFFFKYAGNYGGELIGLHGKRRSVLKGPVNS